jgi:hypothetical protein
MASDLQLSIDQDQDQDQVILQPTVSQPVRLGADDQILHFFE